jgi:para-nitrobenzyl esterase
MLSGETVDGVNIFRGVPFAQPPVGDLRFKPPLPPLAWSRVRDATKFAAAPVQPGLDHVPQSEDCLALNIWSPAPAKNLPGFVWIHGGGFTGGYAFDPLANGTKFAKDGIVCVTIAYRLGVLGFLDVAPLLGNEYEGSTNNGLRDLVAALAWIQQNIEPFGGDPSKVTIGGESAGAKLNDILAGTPSATHLFHQLISESGGAERVAEASGAMAVAQGFAATWNKITGLTTCVSASGCSTNSRRCWRQVCPDLATAFSAPA